MSGAGERRRSGRRPTTVPAAKSSENAGRQPRLLEREVLLSELRTLFSAEWTRPIGAIVLEGRSGVGKSALLGAACQIAADSGWAVLRARGDHSKAAASLSLLGELVGSHEASFSAGRPEAYDAGDVVGELDAFTRELATERGVVIAVDDAQWADEASCAWLSRISRSPVHRRIRLIVGVSARSPGMAPRPIEKIGSEASARVMSLAPLSGEAVAALTHDYFGETADTAFVRACHEATGGIPFLLLSLFRELSLERLPPVGSSVARVESVTSSAVSRSVLARLSRVRPEASVLLDAVAVAGVMGAVDLDLVGDVISMQPAEAGAAAESLVAIDLLAQERPLRFLHPLVRRTVVAEIAPQRRAQLQIAIARGLRDRGVSLERLAEHLLDAETGNDEWVATILEQAGNLALGRGAAQHAVRYLSRALAERPSVRGRLELRLNLARAEAFHDARPALEHLRLALDQGVAPAMAAQAALDVTRCVRDPAGRSDLSPVLAEIASLLGDDDSTVKLELLVTSALVSRSPESLASVVGSLRDLVGRGRRPGTAAQQRGVALIAVIDSGALSRLGTPQVAESIRSALSGAELVSDDSLACELWARTIGSLALAGEFDEADRHARHAQSLSRSQHFDLADAEYSTTLAQSSALQGALVPAEEHARAALRVADGRPWGRRADAVACLMDVLIDGGRLDEADALESSFGSGDFAPSPLEGHHLLEQRGRLRRLQGRWSDALADLLRAGRWADDCGIDNPAVAIWRSQASLACAAAGRDDEALRLAEENLELARLHGGGWVVGSAYHVLANVCPEDDRLRFMQEAVALLEGSALQLRLASALIDLGRALREGGAATSARAALRRGADLAFQSRAAPLLSSAMAELRLTGARPRRLALTGAEALTSSERRVVSLAATGLTNSEIAKELYVAEKTVEGHLLRAFRKLGVRSRRQLTPMLEASGTEDESAP
jgi:DNA-binding CsgD family transcriptional regulator